MSDINVINISGRIGAEPSVKNFESGAVTCEISVAVNKYIHKSQQEKTTWHSCRSWGKIAEYISLNAKTGDTVFVTGSLEKDSYKDKDGKDKSISYILVEQIKIISKNQNDKSSAAAKDKSDGFVSASISEDEIPF